MVLDSSGNVYVADTYNNRVQVFNSSGGYQSQFGSGGTGNGQLSNPRGIALDSSGKVYVADYGNNRVQVFAPNVTAAVPEVPLKPETGLLLVGVGGGFIWVMEKRKRDRKKKMKIAKR